MNKKSTFLAILMAFAPAFALAEASHQHRLATAVLSAENTSYMVITEGENVRVSTFGYKTATETCKFLQSKGVSANHVVNYGESEEPNAFGTITEEIC